MPEKENNPKSTHPKTAEARLDKLRNLALLIAGHQMLIQMLASKWGAVIVEKLDSVEKKLLDAIKEAVQNTSRQESATQTIKELMRLEKQIRTIRKSAIQAAKTEIHDESVDLAENEARWALHITKELDTGKKSAGLSALPDDKSIAIPKQTIVNGKTFDQWFQDLEDGDVSRLQSTVQSGVAQGKTIQDVVKDIQGTLENNYTDGVLETSRVSATRIARTLCSGIANQAKHEFYQQNDDIVMGEEWLSTLDGRTCLHCGAIDRMRWDAKEKHPIPPLHYNCRCVLLPITELSDLSEAEGSRPLANSDFEEDARLAYLAKYPKKDWDALSASTRKKYYYEAINKYERIHGKGTAFTQAPGRITYKEFLEQASPEMQKSILGKYRYEKYKAGKLKIEDFLPPWPDRTMTVSELKKRDKESFRKR